jgi:hypothetical protein
MASLALGTFAVMGASAAEESVTTTKDASGIRPTASADGEVFGPGKVRLTFTRDGRWIDFAADWSGDRVLFNSAGLVVYAEADGSLYEVINTGAGGLDMGESQDGPRRCIEGVRGGFRAPSPEPDDDGDGRVDEDRLDGIDNDNDGRVDEDFAAIGDEMMAACYFPERAGDDLPQLAVHKEAYAWSLPHIDGTIMLSLAIQNTGPQTLENVRIGSFFEKDGPFYCSNWTVGLLGWDDSPRASALVCEDLYGSHVGMIVFATQGDADGSWTGGCVEGEENASAVFLDGLNNPAANGIGKFPLPSTDATESEAAVLKSGETRIDDDAWVYELSPVIGSLGPGEEITVDLAFFAAAEKSDLEARVINTLKTYTGDGIHRYLPPPVSMTPRVLWGSYRPFEPHGGGVDRVVVDIEVLGEEPITPDRISYFSGIDPTAVQRVETEPGVEQIVLRGEPVKKAAAKGERIVLKGRLEDGEFFEAILRPEEGAAGGMASFEDARQFWKAEGRLEMDLLSSSPNPFRDATTIYYEIPSLIEQESGSRIESREPVEISVKVYNVVGRLVSVLAEDFVSPGVYSTQWRAIDDNGNAVASGVYYVRLLIGNKYITQRLILLK